jgi:hypothetical protein
VIAVIATAGVPSGPGPMPASAAELLDKAATAAAAKPDPPVHPGQFTYVETLLTSSQKNVHDHYAQSWVPVDSTGAGGLIRGRNGTQPYVVDGRKSPEPRPPHYSPPPLSLANSTHTYLQTLPTDPNALREIVYEQANHPYDAPPSQAVSACPDRQAFLLVLMLVHGKLIPPTLQAGLFRVIASIPGGSVVDDVVDGAGRHGIGVSWPTCMGDDEHATLIFDKKTYKVLGEQLITYHGKAVITTTIFRSGLVDQIDQIP